MPISKTWLSAIVLGSLLNVLLFVSLTSLSQKVTAKSPSAITVEFMAWQEPQKVKDKPKPKKQVKPKPIKKKIEPKKKVVKKPELSVAEPINTPVEEIVEVEEEVQEPQEEVLPIPVPIFEVSSLPRFLHSQTPIYPPSMKKQGKEGTVLLEALVDEKGNVRQVTIIESAGELFDQAAIVAIQGSSLTPANTNGKPVPVLLRVPIRFRLR